ncbi:MAG TPA: hypothetical protein VHO01_11850 [Jatrophihabitans sp.]|nr:hypothetical protein [Jatrophihabitans sp.]
MVFALIALGLFVLALVGLWAWARRTERDTDFEQAPGVDKSADELRLGIALSSNSNLLGGH